VRERPRRLRIVSFMDLSLCFLSCFLFFGSVPLLHLHGAAGECKRKQCSRRIHRVLKGCTHPDVANHDMERGAREGLVGIFGEEWMMQELRLW
jgi:hypothetical protein